MTIEDDIAFLERVPTLGSLGAEALRILAIGSESRYVHTGERLFQAGEPADSAYVVQEGRLRLSDANGDESTAVTVERGTLLSELALMADTVRQSTATALEPSTVVRIPRNLFLKTLDGYPEAAVRLRDELNRRAGESVRDMQRVRELLSRAKGRD